MKNNTSKVSFVPQLIIPSGTKDISFYKSAFGATELRSFKNDDGSIHVAEFEIAGSIFHLHEENQGKGVFAPQQYNGITTIIGLMVHDVDSYMSSAIAAGAIVTSPAQDYDYGYRQGEVKDPFGHRWLIEQLIASS